MAGFVMLLAIPWLRGLFALDLDRPKSVEEFVGSGEEVPVSGPVEAQSNLIEASGPSRLSRVQRSHTVWNRPWLTTAFTALLIAVGAVLTVGPFISLDALAVLVAIGLFLTGLVELTGTKRGQNAAGFVWLAAGAIISVWPGVTVRVVAIVAGLTMIVGVTPMLVRGQPITLAMAGASITAGIALLVWPGFTVFVIAMAFGVRTILIGLSTAEHPWRATIAVGVTVTLAAAGLWTHAMLPRTDAFYTAPGSVPSTAGGLVRSELLGRAAPAGAIAWRILYTTTRDDHTAAIASALVVWSNHAPAGPRPASAGPACRS